MTTLASRLDRDMLRLGMVRDRVARLARDLEIGRGHEQAWGWDAVAVGACHHLEPGDGVLCNQRTIGPYLARGGDLERLLAELHGKRTGCSGGRGGVFH